MDFYSFLMSLDDSRRESFSAGVGSTFGRLMQIARGNEPARAELCVAIDRESNGAVPYDRVNDRWKDRKGASDSRKRIPMDWAYLERKVRGDEEGSLTQSGELDESA